MKGYYKNPEATADILSADGWLNTGDIGITSESGDILITGRAKSTIVLLGGENAEPEPIEEKLRESSLIDHAVVVGQDKKGLTALISVNEEKLKHMAEKWKISLDEMLHKGGETILNNKIVMEFQKEIKKLINRENGFKPSEKITDVVLLKKKFSIGDELTQTLKVKRKHVEKKYSHLLK
jgi:long-chain acyl-CoA synthetase